MNNSITRHDLENILRNIVAISFEIDENVIMMNSSFKSLDADSLDLFKVIMEIEQHFGIDISDGDIINIKTFHNLVEIVDTLVNKNLKQ